MLGSTLAFRGSLKLQTWPPAALPALGGFTSHPQPFSTACDLDRRPGRNSGPELTVSSSCSLSPPGA